MGSPQSEANPEVTYLALMSAPPSCGHAVAKAYGRFVPQPDVSRCSKLRSSPRPPWGDRGHDGRRLSPRPWFWIGVAAGRQSSLHFRDHHLAKGSGQHTIGVVRDHIEDAVGPRNRNEPVPNEIQRLGPIQRDPRSDRGCWCNAVVQDRLDYRRHGYDINVKRSGEMDLIDTWLQQETDKWWRRRGADRRAKGDVPYTWVEINRR